MLKKVKVIAMSLLVSVGVFGCSKSSTKVEDDKFSVCLILDEGGVLDQSFNQSAWESCLEAKEELGIEATYIESKSEGEYLQNVEIAVDKDVDLVVGVGYKLANAIKEAAVSYPDQKFAIVDGTYDEIPKNIQPILFDEEQAGYCVGLVASQMTKTNTVGFIGGMDIPSVSKFLVGYEKAIKEVNPNMKVLSQYANSFTDASKGRAMAQQMISQNADIIFTCGGGVNVGVWEACNENGLKSIGVDMPSNQFAPDVIITSALKNVGNGVKSTIKDTIDGNFKGGCEVRYDITNGGVGYEITSHLSEEVIKFVEDIINK